jgi:hypothetical protein
MQKIAEYNEVDDLSELYSYIEINKVYLEDQRKLEVKIKLSGDILSIWEPRQRTETELNEGLSVLRKYIYVPTPFKRGDLVEVVDIGGGHLNGAHVLHRLSYENSKVHEELLQSGDTMDMSADVYDILGDGEIFIDDIFYPDLRYCRRELAGEERILKFIGLYLQGGAGLDKLLNTYKYIMRRRI